MICFLDGEGRYLPDMKGIDLHGEGLFLQPVSIAARTILGSHVLLHLFPYIIGACLTVASLHVRHDAFKSEIILPDLTEVILIAEIDFVFSATVKDFVHIMLRQVLHRHIHRDPVMITNRLQQGRVIL